MTPGPRPGARAPWTLRRRLVLAMAGLLALVSITIGLVSVTLLRASLQDGLDQELDSVAARSNSVLMGLRSLGDRLPALPTPTAALILAGPAQPPGTLALVFDETTISAGYTKESGAIAALDARQLGLLGGQMKPGEAVTIDLGGEVGTYRIIANVTRTGVLYLVGLPLSGVDGTATELALIIALVSGIGVVVVGALATVIVRLALRPLQRVTATAARVSGLPLDRGDVTLAFRVPLADTDSRTEVGRVGSALNRMLDHVDAALEARRASEHKVRRFVADASHELRTPLASIRGYSELTRRTGDVLPPDTAHALGRIEAESIRMTGLVEDLLLLARLDEGRELERLPVDLTSLLVDVVSDAHAADPGRALGLDLPDEPVLAVGDAARLHQVFANLLANARIHTPPETAVGVALRMEGDRAVVTVTDDGPGLPENLRSTLFERFARGDSSRFRDEGRASSTGLGLAIALAVVEAHGGEISAVSRPGNTTFRVVLPLE